LEEKTIAFAQNYGDNIVRMSLHLGRRNSPFSLRFGSPSLMVEFGLKNFGTFDLAMFPN
jgi:hypothetical protein